MSGDVDTLREATDFVNLVSSYTELHQSGKDFRGRCPVHGGDSTTAFVVYPDSKSFYCFRCGSKGDLFDFVKTVENLDFRGSMDFLSRHTGVPLKNTGSGRRRSDSERVLDDAIHFWRDQLFSEVGERAREYLLSRGIAEHVWRPAGIGFCPEPAFRTMAHLTDLGHSEAAIMAANIYTEKKFSHLTGKVVIPIKTKGRVSNLYARSIGFVPKGERHRYTGAHSGLFALDEVQEGEPVTVVEGILDALALRSAGIKNVVATYGTSGLDADGVAEIVSRAPRHAVLFFDGDDAGRSAARRAAEMFTSAGLEYRIAITPEDEDPSSLVAAGADVEILVEAAGTLGDIAARRLVRKMSASTPEDRVLMGAALEKLACSGVGQLTSAVALNEIAKALDLSPELVKYEFNRLVADSQPDTGKSHPL